MNDLSLLSLSLSAFRFPVSISHVNNFKYNRKREKGRIPIIYNCKRRKKLTEPTGIRTRDPSVSFLALRLLPHDIALILLS